MRTEKRCSKCKVVQPVCNFDSHKGVSGGLACHCKACKKDYLVAYRAKNREHVLSLARERDNRPVNREKKKKQRQTPSGAEISRAATARHRKNFPEKDRARKLAANAVERGDLLRQPCEICGEYPAHGHHDDYTKPLEVRWLCVKHHNEWHRLNKARTSEDYAAKETPPHGGETP